MTLTGLPTYSRTPAPQLLVHGTEDIYVPQGYTRPEQNLQKVVLLPQAGGSNDVYLLKTLEVKCK